MGALDWLGVGLDALGIGVGASSQAAANRANLKNSREQRQFEQMMSNTAIRRRQSDIVAAGGNPALAFVGGGEASTPSYQPAHAEPTIHGSDFNFTGKLMAKAQTRLIDKQADVADAQAANLRQQTLVGESTATQQQQQTKNLEQALANLKEELKGIVSKNDIQAIDAKIAGLTQNQKVAQVDAQLRKLRAEATSAEKKAILDKAITEFVTAAQAKLQAFFKPQISPGAPGKQKGTYKAPWKPRSHQ